MNYVETYETTISVNKNWESISISYGSLYYV